MLICDNCSSEITEYDTVQRVQDLQCRVTSLLSSSEPPVGEFLAELQILQNLIDQLLSI